MIYIILLLLWHWQWIVIIVIAVINMVARRHLIHKYLILNLKSISLWRPDVTIEYILVNFRVLFMNITIIFTGWIHIITLKHFIWIKFNRLVNYSLKKAIVSLIIYIILMLVRIRSTTFILKWGIKFTSNSSVIINLAIIIIWDSFLRFWIATSYFSLFI